MTEGVLTSGVLLDTISLSLLLIESGTNIAAREDIVVTVVVVTAGGEKNKFFLGSVFVRHVT